MNDRPKIDRDLDEAIEESFPASDPPANTVETAVRIEPSPAPSAGRDDRDTPDAETDRGSA